MSKRSLTTTSYAILGVLAIRPWPAYELTNYMRTSAIRRSWPRTESRLYAEPKNLVAHGLAEVSMEFTGRRRRTVYSITRAGKKALTRWLGERASPPESEDEALLKMLLADHGGRDQLLGTIRRAMEDLLEVVARVMDVTARVAAGQPRFPERLHVTALSARYGITAGQQRFEFLKWAEDWVRTWKDTNLEGKEEEAIAVLADSRTKLEDLNRELRNRLARAAR